MSQRNAVIPDIFTIDLDTGELQAPYLQGKTIDIDFKEIDTGVYDMLAQWVAMQRKRNEEE